MQYPVIDLIAQAYLNNGWTGLDIPETITYEPIQLGSGIPSPDNVRPILPATILNIGGNDVPVYGGSLDVTTGVLTVDRAEVDLGSLTWNYVESYTMFYGNILRQSTSVDKIGISSEYTQVDAWVTGTEWVNGDKIFTLQGRDNAIRMKDTLYTDAAAFKDAMSGVQFVYELATPTTYQLTQTELYNAIGIKDDIAHRLKLPLPHYFSHPVIDSLKRASEGTMTNKDKEILTDYLTPLGIGGI